MTHDDDRSAEVVAQDFGGEIAGRRRLPDLDRDAEMSSERLDGLLRPLPLAGEDGTDPGVAENVDEFLGASPPDVVQRWVAGHRWQIDVGVTQQHRDCRADEP